MLQVFILLASAVLVGLDQLTKYLAVLYLEGQPAVEIIPGVLELHFLYNPGVAFGLFPGNRWIFIVLTSVMLVILLAALLSGKFRQYKLVIFSGILIVAGGAGNLIDRIVLGKVVDFISFQAINFPIFNLADCFVVVGAALLLIFFLFFYTEDRTAGKKTAAEAGAPVPLEAAVFGGESMPDGEIASPSGEGETADETGADDSLPGEDGGETGPIPQ